MSEKCNLTIISGILISDDCFSILASTIQLCTIFIQIITSLSHQDILQGEILEDYFLLGYKSLAWMVWSQQYCQVNQIKISLTLYMRILRHKLLYCNSQLISQSWAACTFKKIFLFKYGVAVYVLYKMPLSGKNTCYSW